jgi:ECF transporter S component (folate family)
VPYHGKLGLDEHICGGEIARPLRNILFSRGPLTIRRFFIMQRKYLLSTRGITLVAMLVAMAIVLKSVLSFETGSFRFTFYEIPMTFIGLMFGPVIGGIMGFVVDFFHIMFSPFAFTFNVFTVSNMLWGIIPGLLLFQKEYSRVRLVIVLLITGILTFGLNTIGIVQYQGQGAMLATLPYRIAVFFIKLPLQVVVIEIIYQRVIVSTFQMIKSRIL